MLFALPQRAAPAFMPLPSLYSSSIGDEGAAAIGGALKHNRALTKLE